MTADEWPDPRRRPTERINPRKVDTWPVEITEYTLRCRRCGEPIVGSGQGTFGVLERLVREHIRDKCSQRFRRVAR